MNTKVLNDLTPQMIKDFIKELQRNGFVKRGFLKVTKEFNYSKTFIVKIISYKIEQFIFKAYDSTFSFMDINDDSLLDDVWLIFLIRTFGFYKVIQERDNIIFIEDAAFFHELLQVDEIGIMGPGYVARDIILNPKLALEDFEKDIPISVSGWGTGYSCGKKYYNHAFFSATLSTMQTSSVITSDNIWILISNIAKKDKHALTYACGY